MSMDLAIDIYFDFVCPWCLIGKRHLEKALAQFEAGGPAVDITLNWRGVQLVPEVPAQGWPFAEFYAQRLGSADAVRLRQQQVENVAAQSGLRLRLADIRQFPNTARAHALLDSARPYASTQQFNALIERLFSAYFLQAEDIGDVAVLLRIANECGIETSAIAECLAVIDQLYVPAIAVSGAVPRFVFNRQIILEGAQPAATLLQAMRTAVQIGGGVKGRS